MRRFYFATHFLGTFASHLQSVRSPCCCQPGHPSPRDICQTRPSQPTLPELEHFGLLLPRPRPFHLATTSLEKNKSKHLFPHTHTPQLDGTQLPLSTTSSIHLPVPYRFTPGRPSSIHQVRYKDCLPGAAQRSLFCVPKPKRLTSSVSPKSSHLYLTDQPPSLEV